MTATTNLDLLVERCLVNDQDAWEELVRRHRGLIFHVAFRFNLRDYDADDVFQSTCLQVFRSLGKLRLGSNDDHVTHWITLVARWECWRLLGRNRKHSYLLRFDEIPEDGPPIEPVDPYESHEETFLRIELGRTLRRAVAELPLRQRHLISVIYFDTRFDKLSYEEVSKIVGISQGNVGKALERSLRELRRLIKQRRLPRFKPIEVTRTEPERNPPTQASPTWKETTVFAPERKAAFRVKKAADRAMDEQRKVDQIHALYLAFGGGSPCPCRNCVSDRPAAGARRFSLLDAVRGAK